MLPGSHPLAELSFTGNLMHARMRNRVCHTTCQRWRSLFGRDMTKAALPLVQPRVKLIVHPVINVTDSLLPVSIVSAFDLRAQRYNFLFCFCLRPYRAYR